MCEGMVTQTHKNCISSQRQCHTIDRDKIQSISTSVIIIGFLAHYQILEFQAREMDQIERIGIVHFSSSFGISRNVQRRHPT